MNNATVSYKNHRFLPQIIAHAVWLYCRLPPWLVEEMLLERGIVVSHETIRRTWKFAGIVANAPDAFGSRAMA